MVELTTNKMLTPTNPGYALVEAKELKDQLTFVKDNRNVEDVARLEGVYRRFLSPLVPSFDVSRIQPTRYDEYTFTDGLSSFLAFTQSVEINARIAIAAAGWKGKIKRDFAREIADSVDDKWALRKQSKSSRGRKVFFPPGDNLSFIISEQLVAREFDRDPGWMMKPHPMSSAEDVREWKLRIGFTRMFTQFEKAMPLVRKAAAIGYTTTSELGIIAMLLDKPTFDFTDYEFEGWGCYHPIYEAIRNHPDLKPSTVINRLWNCPWSGMMPLDTEDDEAERRFTQFKHTAEKLRETYSPVTQPLSSPERK